MSRKKEEIFYLTEEIALLPIQRKRKMISRLALQSIKIIMPVLILSFFLTGCFQRKWSDEKRENFKQQCKKIKSFENMVVRFIGFENSEFDSIIIQEYNGSILLDSFNLNVFPAQSPSDKENKERSATIERAMNINYSYHMIIPGEAPYILDNMKMIMWAQFTMSSEGWGCVMGDYTIDGERFEHNANPTFIKRNNGEMVRP